jgi:hypothetical protein
LPVTTTRVPLAPLVTVRGIEKASLEEDGVAASPCASAELLKQSIPIVARKQSLDTLLAIEVI